MSCPHNSLMACFECSAKRTEAELREARGELAWWREAFAPRFVGHGPGKLPPVGTALTGIRLKVYVAAPPGLPDRPWQPYNGGQKCDANEGPCACGATTPSVRCTRPPSGWWCSREPDHDGPCAAREVEGPERALREALRLALSRPNRWEQREARGCWRCFACDARTDSEKGGCTAHGCWVEAAEMLLRELGG